MKLHAPFVQLPLIFDADVLAAEVLAIEESHWKPHPQGFPGNSMLPLVAVHGDPDNEAFAGPMLPTPHLRRCPYLMQTLASFGATVGRTRLMRLSGQAEVSRHTDQGYYWTERVRIHVPIVTQPTVRFECGGAVVNMAAGECWIFDTWRQHCVLNDDERSRIHLVCDSVGGVGFWDLVGQGRPHGAPVSAGAWAPRRVAPDASLPVDFPCESENVPAVMTPWELGQHFGFLFAEAVPHPALQTLHLMAARLTREWKALWAQHGERESGRPAFRAAFDAFLAAARAPAQGVMLRNEMPWFDVVQIMLGRTVVAAPAASAAGPHDAAAQRAVGDYA